MTKYSTEHLLDIRDLKLSYGGISAVKGINFHVNSKELVTLIGANGAGKTSTLKIIAGLLKPSAGSIHFSGMAIGGKPAYELAQHGIGLVPEGRGVFARMTILENLQMGAYLRQASDPTERITHDLDGVLELFPRLKERLNQLAGTLSGGEQQMLAIAPALMARPKLLLLDEPTRGIDVGTKAEIYRLMGQLAADGKAGWAVGTGIVYLGATARLSYALGEEREMPSALATTNAEGVPVVSILVAAAIGSLALGLALVARPRSVERRVGLDRMFVWHRILGENRIRALL